MTDTDKSADTFESWAILELLGHRRLAGFVRETTIAGAGMLRIDIPAVNGREKMTQFYHPSALYGLSPCSAEVARAVAARTHAAPVYSYELPAIADQSDDEDDDPDFSEVE